METRQNAQEAVDRAVAAVVEQLTEGVELGLQDRTRDGTRRLFAVLVRAALDHAQRRGYKAAPSQVTFLAGAELVAAALGISRPTLWRRLDTLQAAGLVATRRWYTEVPGELVPGAKQSKRQRADAKKAAQEAAGSPETGADDDEGPTVRLTAGTLFTVRLVRGRAHVHTEDLQHGNWRDLAGAIAEGRTFRRKLNALERPKDDVETAELIVTSALPPRDRALRYSNAFSSGQDAGNAAPAELSELFDLPGLARVDRAPRVNALAHTAAGLLRDGANLDMHRWVIWQALRLADAGQPWALDRVHSTLQRIAFDARDPNRTTELRRPGARYVAELRALGVWDALRLAPAHRVGVAA